MSITSKSEINNIKQILQSRDAKLYHACQLQDFRSYIKLGGIPSRNKLSTSELPFTAFDTDNIDKNHLLWDKVFGNFSDFGTGFSRAKSNSFPNPYGPIQVVLNPSFLDDVDDIAISLRSAGATDFDRKIESLQSSDNFNLIYSNIQKQNNNSDKYIAFSKILNERFQKTNCTSPEFNCTIDNETILFKHCAYIIVDNCVSKGRLLIDIVSSLASKKTFPRKYEGNKGDIILEISKITAEHDCTKQKLLNNPNASDDLKKTITGMNDFHFDRFIRYLTNGTTRA